MLKQDSYLLSGSWHFNKNKPYHFVTRLNAGYFYSDLEEDMFKEIPHFFFFHRNRFFHTILKIAHSLNVGTGITSLLKRTAILLEPYSHSTFTLIFITHFFKKNNESNLLIVFLIAIVSYSCSDPALPMIY
jgi:hypothetical protein